MISQKLKRRQVNGRLGKPHPIRLAAESPLEVGDPPFDQGGTVPHIGKWQDRMHVRVRECAAMTSVAGPAFTVALDDAAIGLGGVSFKPPKECRADVEADRSIVVDQPDNPPL